MSLRIADLHEMYRSVDEIEACRIANLGAEVYVMMRDRLREAWAAEMSAEEGTKATGWRTEGRMAALEEVKERLAAGEAAAARATVLQASIEEEVGRRLGEVLELRHKEYELQKKEAVHVLETRLAETKGVAKAYAMLEEAHEAMRQRIETLQEEVAKHKAATSTKSSHALGKLGEAEVFEMLNGYVLPRFPYAEVRDMTAVKHVADFHLWVFGPTGNRVKILIDSKKYATPVQHGEIEKLYSDVDADEEAHSGLLISLDSAIASKTQFQITRTKKGKPCLFLSFEKLDDGLRQEILCWAVRTIVGLISVHDKVKQDNLLSDIQIFLADVGASITDLDGCLKTCKSMTESLRDAKERLVSRMNGFRIRSGMMSADDMIVQEDDFSRCVAVVGKGDQCKSRRIPNTMLCSRHKAMESDGKIISKIV